MSQQQLMTKRLLGCVVLFAYGGWSSDAEAALATAADPIAVGNVVVLHEGTASTTITATTDETLDHFSTAGDCAGFVLTPAATLPELITAATPLGLEVAFTPPDRGGQATPCVITMRDGANASLGTFTVTGTGVAAELGAPASQAFGAVRVLGGTATRTITITNDGDPGQTLTVSSYAIAGGNAGDFEITNTPATSIAPGASTDVVVQFDAGGPGPRASALVIESNDPVSPTTSVTLSGSGTNALIAVTDRAFGVVAAGSTLASTITVSNTGASPQGPLHVSSATISGGSGWFTFDTNGGSNCAGDTTCAFALDIPPSAAIGVRCAPPPGATGSQTATVAFTSDSDAGGDPSSTLTCTAGVGALATSVPSLAFGGVPVGGNVPLTFTLRNTGNAPVTGIAAAVDPANTGYSLDAAPTSLPVGGSMVLTARFRPQAGTDGGAATITFTGGGGETAVLDLTGDGLTAGFTTTVATLDLGGVRFNANTTRTFCIANPFEASVAIQNPLAIAPMPGTTSGELAIAGIKRQTTCGTGGTTVTLPQTLATNELLEITVRAAPANRLGALAATLTINSNLPMNPSRTVALMATSTSAMIAEPAMLDFGAIDVQAGPVTRDVTLTNTGAAPLDLGSFARTVDAHFTLALPPNQVLQPGTSLTIPVTYKPTVVSADGFTLSHSIGGVFGGPAGGSVLVKGRGIDRKLSLGAAPQFPDTFRNPGDNAPVRPIAVQNLGEAPLRVTAVMITDEDQTWSIVDAAAVEIPFHASHEVLVRFAPTHTGRSQATLQIFNDDDAQMIASVALSGNGRDRNVSFGPDTIRLGYTGVGVPVTIPDVLVVTSTDPVNAYKIRSIEVAEGSPFTIEGATTDLDLAPQGTRTFSVTFAPTARGPISAHVSLYLDSDPETHHDVVLEGEAVFVDAHGGGGCSTGGGPAGLAAALGLLALRRRRTAAVAALMVLAVPAARADDVVLSVFDPAPATVANGFQVQSPEVGAPGAWAASAVVSHATDPLVLDGVQGGQVVNATGVVRSSTQFELGLAVALFDRLELGAHMPLYVQDGDPYGDPSQMFTAPPASGTARGDLTLHGKVRLGHRALAGDGALDLGASAGLTLPTASDGQFTGTEKPAVRALVLGSLRPGALGGRLTLTVNAGGVVRATSRYANLEQKSGAAWGLGASVRALDELSVTGEVYGDTVFGGRVDEMGGAQTLAPVEWLAGLRWRPDRRVAVAVGAGRGLTGAVGTPALRGVFSISLTPGAAEVRPIHAPRPDGDADGDGIRDSKDQCPNEPEDKDLFDDTDGCPDPDNDHDGVADDQDRCPLEPEDKDGFEDGDGCADRDNDGDGVPDDQDRCPNAPEDQDGFDDLDGCPDPDNDHDGLLDDKDKCPTDPETINGVKDDDGCPDKGDGVVVLGPDRLELLDAVQFTGGKLARQSFNALGQVAATLRAHPEIVRLRVTAHVQPTQDAQRDQDLSEKRAQAVRDWLVQWGIAVGRVEARGFGGTRPIVKPEQRGAAALNDRIELVILERK